MRKSFLALLCLACVFAVSMWAQAPAGPPKPAPELKRLNYYAGDWNTQGTMQPGPMGPGGKFTSKDHFAWELGNNFLVMRSDGEMAGMGKIKSVSYMGYDPQKKMYTYHAFDTMGMAENSTGNVKGGDWTWTDENVMNGKTYNGRYTAHEESPTSYTFKFEMSEDGGKTWKPMMEGKSTKAGGKTEAKNSEAAPAQKEAPPKKK